MSAKSPTSIESQIKKLHGFKDFMCFKAKFWLTSLIVEII